MLWLLGWGGMPPVYEMAHRLLRRRHALKLLPGNCAVRPWPCVASGAGRCWSVNPDHPHLVPVDALGKRTAAMGSG